MEIRNESGDVTNRPQNAGALARPPVCPGPIESEPIGGAGSVPIIMDGAVAETLVGCRQPRGSLRGPSTTGCGRVRPCQERASVSKMTVYANCPGQAGLLQPCSIRRIELNARILTSAVTGSELLGSEASFFDLANWSRPSRRSAGVIRMVRLMTRNAPTNPTGSA